MTATIAPFESKSEAVRFQSEVSVMVIKIDHTPLTSSHSHHSRVTRSISHTHMTFFQQQAPEVLTAQLSSRMPFCSLVAVGINRAIQQQITLSP